MYNHQRDLYKYKIYLHSTQSSLPSSLKGKDGWLTFQILNMLLELNYRRMTDGKISASPLDLDEILKKNQNRQKYYHILKEHPKLSKITKFGCEMF